MRFVKIALAAIAFGIIAGMTFQGYVNLSNSQEKEQRDDYNKLVTNKEDKDREEYPSNSIDIVDDPLLSVDSSADTIVTDVSEIVDQVMASIVAINATGNQVGFDFFGRQFNQPVSGSGSGIIIGQSGSEVLIVTNNHVVAEKDQVEIVFVDESTAMATLRGADKKTDLAVIAVQMEDLTEETIATIRSAKLGNSNEVKPGEMAIAIGNALGYGQSVTVGYISAVDREVTIERIRMKLIQTDAAINPGNSGGALMNAEGEVIGINSVKLADSKIEGMGYAIPITDAIPMINELMNRETLEQTEQGYLGINTRTAQNVNEVYSERFNMPIGIYVNDIEANSPVDKAGLRPGHIIVGFDGKTVETIEDLLNILSYTRAGEEVILEVNALEDGNYVKKELNVILGRRP